MYLTVHTFYVNISGNMKSGSYHKSFKNILFTELKSRFRVTISSTIYGLSFSSPSDSSFGESVLLGYLTYHYQVGPLKYLRFLSGRSLGLWSKTLKPVLCVVESSVPIPVVKGPDPSLWFKVLPEILNWILPETWTPSYLDVHLSVVTVFVSFDLIWTVVNVIEVIREKLLLLPTHLSLLSEKELEKHDTKCLIIRVVIEKIFRTILTIRVWNMRSLRLDLDSVPDS